MGCVVVRSYCILIWVAVYLAVGSYRVEHGAGPSLPGLPVLRKGFMRVIDVIRPKKGAYAEEILNKPP